jgi:hypothetical protein
MQFSSRTCCCATFNYHLRQQGHGSGVQHLPLAVPAAVGAAVVVSAASLLLLLLLLVLLLLLPTRDASQHDCNTRLQHLSVDVFMSLCAAAVAAAAAAVTMLLLPLV